jgi:hypothetical protein
VELVGYEDDEAGSSLDLDNRQFTFESKTENFIFALIAQ